MANRKRHAVDSAPPGRWALLGRLLAAWRAIELGYDTQTGFARDCLPLTAKGNPNVRLVADVENNRRHTYPEPKLKLIAHWYRVSYSSVLAVLAGDADELAPERPALAVVAAEAGAPMTDPQRQAANEPYALAIYRQLARTLGVTVEYLIMLPSRDIPDPGGEKIFGPGSWEAKAWDDARDWPGLDLRDRVWVIADVQRRAAGRGGNSGTASASA